MRLCHLGQQLMTSRTSRGISPDSYRLPQDKAALAVLVPRVYNSVRSLGESGMHKLIVAVAVLFVPVLSQLAPIIAQENVRKRLAAGRKAPGPEILPQPTNVLPVITFEDKVSVHLNGEDVQAIHLPKGHTDGDSAIFFPQSNVLHMGDDFVMYGFPFVDLNSGGSVRGMIDALKKVVTLVPPEVKVIPGHGQLSTLDDVRAFSKMVEETFNLVAAQVNQGKSAE